MSLTERVEVMQEIFESLQGTNSRLAKQDIIDRIPGELKDDFDFCLEILAGKHKLGYKYEYVSGVPDVLRFRTIKDVYKYLQQPSIEHDLSRANIYKHLANTYLWADFLEPLCNRIYKLGIGQSILEKSSIAPMLAKKYEGQNLPKVDVYITEKLDGNRCIAYHEDDRWHFVSRNGKRMNVDFDMSGLPEELVYDGEVISPAQAEMSDCILYSITTKNTVAKIKTDFNSTSGLINRRTTNKDLVYCIFDIQDTAPYSARRMLLEHLNPTARNVKIHKILTTVNYGDEQYLGELLDQVVSIGGEGLMLNLANAPYENKRTNYLLKYKQIQTMDMKVIGLTDGTGKYEGMVGALECAVYDRDKRIICSVGSGLSDAQRLNWQLHPENIVGKIVEVSYFSLSQNKDNASTSYYSLRFPRLKGVREDKSTTSIH